MKRLVLVLYAALVAFTLAGCSSVLSRHAGAAGQVSKAVAATPAAVAATPTSTPTPVAPPQASVCAGVPAGTDHIFVSISQQTLWACSGPNLYLSTAVTTGASALTNVHDATPIGTWPIYSKVRNAVLRGHDANGSWTDHVAYWMPFHGPYGLHDASWQTFPFGSALYTTQGSHGCVHVPVDVLGTIYTWAPIGTLVTTEA